MNLFYSNENIFILLNLYYKIFNVNIQTQKFL